jgi:hypothetical protein
MIPLEDSAEVMNGILTATIGMKNGPGFKLPPS